MLLALPSRFNEIDVEEASAEGRVDSWYEGVQMFIGHPIFGVGPDMYSDYHHLTAHNSFVLVMAETGIIGYTLWLAFILYGFRMMWAASRGMGQPAVRDEEALEAELDAAAAAGEDVDALLAAEDAREASIAEGRGIAMALMLSLTGFFTCAFFLSRSYVVILYLLAAVVVAHYVDMRRDDPSLPHFTLSKDFLLLPIIGVVATIGLMVVVKVLLVIQ